MTGKTYDVVVVGGGAAGLNGALMLARSRRSVMVIDAGSPRNAPAEGVHGLLGREGMPPAELLAIGREEVRSYGGELRTGEVVSARRLTTADSPTTAGADNEATASSDNKTTTDADNKTTASGDNATAGGGFEVTLAGGDTVRARRLLVTTGLVDLLPEVPGLRERWGRDLLHCPYCHGWEVRDKAIGIIATSPMSVHQALLFRQLSDDVVYLLHQAPMPEPEQVEQLTARGIRIVEGTLTGVEVTDGKLSGVTLRDGTSVAREALAVGTRMVARGGFLEGLGLKAVDHPMGVGEHVPADPFGRTDVEGVWVAGNVTDLAAQVGSAAAGGAMAGAQINADLVAEDTRAAVSAARGDTSDR
jgi:thioredoxin reductase